MTASRAAPSSGSSGTTPKAPVQGGARKAGQPSAGDWLDRARQVWEQTANRALEQAGRAERIDGRSLADRRDAAHREGDLEQAAELSREPNVHRGPGQYLDERGRASATVAQEARVKQRTATARAERDADRRQVERLEREIAGVGARLKETYDRVRTALDRRIQQAGRAVHAGAEETRRMDRRVGRTCHDLDRRLRLALENVNRMIDASNSVRGSWTNFCDDPPEAEQKRKDGDRPDRVEGLIESRIQKQNAQPGT